MYMGRSGGSGWSPETLGATGPLGRPRYMDRLLCAVLGTVLDHLFGVFLSYPCQVCWGATLRVGVPKLLGLAAR